MQSFSSMTFPYPSIGSASTFFGIRSHRTIVVSGNLALPVTNIGDGRG